MWIVCAISVHIPIASIFFFFFLKKATILYLMFFTSKRPGIHTHKYKKKTMSNHEPLILEVWNIILG